MKTVLIPTNMNPWTCEINGMKFSYKAGTEQTVPDEVAELIEAYNESLPKEAKEAGEEGQVWTKEQYGAGWEDLWIPKAGTERSKFLYVDHNGVVQWKGVNQVPSGGTEGQVLTKTADGEGWADAKGSNIKLIGESDGALDFQSGTIELTEDYDKFDILVFDIGGAGQQARSITSYLLVAGIVTQETSLFYDMMVTTNIGTLNGARFTSANKKSIGFNGNASKCNKLKVYGIKF